VVFPLLGPLTNSLQGFLGSAVSGCERARAQASGSPKQLARSPSSGRAEPFALTGGSRGAFEASLREQR
jgi:hypothetical protein